MVQPSNILFPCSCIAEIVRKDGYSLSDKQLSERVGISRTTLHRLCTDPTSNPKWQTLVRLLQICDHRVHIQAAKPSEDPPCQTP